MALALSTADIGRTPVAVTQYFTIVVTFPSSLELPVAALRSVPNTLVRSGPFPPVEGGGLRGGGLFGLGVVLSFLLFSSSSTSSSFRFLESSSSLDLQHTVPLSHLYLSSTSLQTEDIIWGMQTPGHFRLTLLDDNEDDDDFGREVEDFLLS